MAGIYSVSQVNSYIKNMFAQDFALSRISVRGEVSNCKYHTSGHIYFTLKDKTGTLAAVMFAGQRRGLSFQLQEGQQVVVTGTVDVYERDGKYQLYARKIEQDGQGDLFLRFQKLRDQLEEMGMFAPEYKQPIPRYARTVGVVTASTGAAIRDIMNITARRNPYVQLILYPALVQGAGAAASIVRGIQTLDEMGLDVLIVGRGGGSIEDLWAFNEEPVARAIFNCRTPVISAVGHETDFSISDFVADLRAPTPSAAAELAVPNIKDVITKLKEYENRQKIALSRKLQIMKLRYEKCINSKAFKMPLQRINEKYMLIDIKVKQLEGYITKRYIKEKSKTLNLLTKLDGLSPLKTLTRGYGIITLNGKTIKSVQNLNKEDEINIKLYDGTVNAKILSKECD